ncbi:MAG TPA: hypothetical protein PLJ34_04575 [Hyphomicrobiales bacterium]|nr:hypothetical protein [Hyphomicrobiales bacterium]
MDWSIAFSPLVPLWLLGLGAALLAISAVVVFWRRMRGGSLRIAAGALVLLALADPAIVSEERRPLAGVVAVVVDRSPSQSLAERSATTDRALADLEDRLAGLRGFEVRIVEAARSDGTVDGTHLFSALSEALSDVSPDRVAGAILVTDGEVHDVPKSAAELGFAAPVHILLSGRPDERDRRLETVAAPRFGLVDKEQTVTVRLTDTSAPAGSPATVTLRRDGEVIETRPARSGETISLPVTIVHGGETIVEIEASPLAGELTELNNRVVARIEGIREALRVLLVSGEPHPGERTWRNLLKSDTSVDLVHFTILRPPEKQDGTPINQLSLIAFPTRQLFEEKIDDFDLIIFDRYRRRGVLPTIYFDNMARYVRDGGAILIAAGPEYATPDSVYESPLSPVLPGAPTGEVVEAPFRPLVSKAGARHPVTRDLPGAGTGGQPGWGPWYRLVDVAPLGGDTVMEDGDGRPLLLLEHDGKGRVALLASDQVWLWARGHDGGGPHVDLLRRLAHWLMKEPDLEEEALRASVSARSLLVERQTMGEAVEPVTVTTPSGKTETVELAAAAPGVWRALLPAEELGLYRVGDGTRVAFALAGTPNPKEFAEVVSTAERLGPIAGETGGGVFRLTAAGGADRPLPRIVPMREARRLAGEDWMGLREAGASVLEGIDRTPLFLGLFGLALLVGAFAATWYREGR